MNTKKTKKDVDDQVLFEAYDDQGAESSGQEPMEVAVSSPSGL